MKWTKIRTELSICRKQLVVATEVGTIASRIKANINNIQRSGRAMDTNFAKR